MKTVLLLLAQGVGGITLFLLIFSLFVAHLCASFVFPVLGILQADAGHGWRAAGWFAATLLTWGGWNLYGGSEDSGMHDY